MNPQARKITSLSGSFSVIARWMAICGRFGKRELEAYIVLGGNVVGSRLQRHKRKWCHFLRYSVLDAFPKGKVVWWTCRRGKIVGVQMVWPKPGFDMTSLRAAKILGTSRWVNTRFQTKPIGDPDCRLATKCSSFSSVLGVNSTTDCEKEEQCCSGHKA